MKAIHFVCLIAIGITASNLYNVNCCKSIRSRKHKTQITIPNDRVKRKIVLLSYDNANTPDRDSHEADQVNTSSDLMKGITLETSRKVKRNSPAFQSFPSHDDGVSNNNSNKTAPRTLIATIGDDDNDDALPNNQKTKRNPSNDNDPLTMQKLRRARDKKFMCLCEETKCRNKECLQKLLRTDAKKTSQDSTADDAENNSAEDLRNENEVLQDTGPKKFSIPFANNVNFDQRVQIVDGKNEPKPPPNTLYPVYANPQNYHFTPFTLAHPGLIYTGLSPSQQNYAPAAAYNQLPSPSPIPANLLKLWKTGVQKLLPAPAEIPKKAPQVPNFSSESAKNEPAKESNKVTTPRQVDNKLYPPRYPSTGAFNIEDLRPAYSYSTDFAYNDHYTTEVVAADNLKFLGGTSTEARLLDFGDPTTTSYAPSYPQRMGGAMNNAYSPNYQTAPRNRYPGENLGAAYPGNENIPQYDHNGMPVMEHNGYPSLEDLYNPQNGQDLSIEVDRMIDNYGNDAPTMSVPNDADLRAYNPDFAIQSPDSYDIQRANPPGEPQTNTEVYNKAGRPATTLQDVNTGYTSHYNPQRTSTLRDLSGFKNNFGIAAATAAAAAIAAANGRNKVSDMDKLFRGIEKVIQNSGEVSDAPEAQAIDERPSTTHEEDTEVNNFDSALVQNAVRKVLNNFVPGKAEDLLANYDSQNQKSRQLGRKNAERLSPDIANAHVLKNLLNLPEVEDMIVDTANNLINQVTGSPVPDKAIKNTLRNVVSEIPKPTPSKRDGRMRLRFAKRRPRYDDSANREVFEKIKSIIDKSELGEEAATHPLAQNLIVKTVKHSIDKEKGVADEAAIRRAFSQLVKSRLLNGNDNDKVADREPTYTTENTGYKPAPKVPVKERRLQGGVWVESPKSLVENRPGGDAASIEKKRKELERQLDYLRQYDKPNSTSYVNDESTENVAVPYYTTKSDVSTRQALSRFYDVLETTANPQNIPLINGFPTNPIVTTINYQNYRDPMYTTQQPDDSRVNLLVDSTEKSSTDESLEEPAYMGKLVPVNPIEGSTENSKNLVWVGDGVRLPLTMRRMPDGSFALTLSDEVCQMFAHKKCPCCLPAAGQGVIVRERRDDENDFAESAGKKEFADKISGNYRVRRDSSELTTTSSNTFSNAIGQHYFNSADYDESEEENSIERRAPYKYQRYASQDRIISGSTRALGNMLKLMKDVVTEAHEKLQRRPIEASKQKTLLF